jgi:hypothetical protein
MSAHAVIPGTEVGEPGGHLLVPDLQRTVPSRTARRIRRVAMRGRKRVAGALRPLLHVLFGTERPVLPCR